MEMPSLKEFRHLRVLDLEHCHQLEDHHLENIVKLIHLRHLNLKNTGIKKLPEQIGHLGCLQMLDLSRTDVEELPASIVNLGKLSHLLVDNGVNFPDGIAKMQALEILECVRVFKQKFDFLWGFGQLKNLRNLVLDGFKVDSDSEDTNVVEEECDKAIVSSLCKLGTQNLRSLTIWDGSSLLQEPLCPLSLEKLIIWSSPVPQVPKWGSSLRNPQELRLEVQGVKQNDLCTLGALPALLILDLEGVTDSNERLRVSGEIGFRFLKGFKYDAHHPVDLMFPAGSMPKLEKFEINCYGIVQANTVEGVTDSNERVRISGETGFQFMIFFIYNANYHPVDLMFATGSMPKVELMPKYLRVVEAGSLDFGIKNLPCLTTVRCIVYGDDGITEAVKTAMERAVSTHPNHPTLVSNYYRF